MSLKHKKRFEYRFSYQTFDRESNNTKIVSRNGSICKGIFEYTADGHGRVISENKELKIYIPPHAINGAMHADLVEVCMSNQRNKRNGRITRIIKRAHSQCVGKVYLCKGKIFLKPHNFRHRYPIIVDFSNLNHFVKNGMYLVTKIIEYPTKRNPSIKALPIKYIGQDGTNGIQRKVIEQEYSIPCKFPVSVLKEIEYLTDDIPLREIQRRKDLRNEKTITIDGANAKDFDDAVSIKRLKSGNFLLDVHIADVSFYVKPGTQLDNEALKRATSVYFADDTVIPMLPSTLSDNICSLVPNRDRLTFTCRMEFDGTGELLNVELFESIIHSKARMTYEEVNMILEDEDYGMIDKHRWLYNDLCLMQTLTRILMAKRKRDGSIDLNVPKSYPIFNKSGEVVCIESDKQLFSHRIVEEFMLAANAGVTRLVMGKPFIFRVHSKPEQKKIDLIRKILTNWGYDWNNEIKSLARQFSEIMLKAESNDEGDMLKLLLLHEATMGAKYSSKNSSHFALNFDSYTHFTSPIRRYADILVHRLLKSYIGISKSKFTLSRLDIESIINSCNHRRNIAKKAENEFANWMMLDYLKSKNGKTLDGVVNRIFGSMFYVALKDFGVSGLVFVSNIKDDQYVWDKERYRIIGKANKRTFRIGDIIKVKLEDIDIDERKPVLSVAA